MRQCWPAISVANHMWGGLRAFSGPQYFYSTPLEVKSFGRIHCIQQVLIMDSLIPIRGPMPYTVRILF